MSFLAGKRVLKFIISARKIDTSAYHLAVDFEALRRVCDALSRFDRRAVAQCSTTLELLRTWRRTIALFVVKLIGYFGAADRIVVCQSKYTPLVQFF